MYVVLVALACNYIPPVSFFFSLYGAHRDLHSFPTRRSSDLTTAIAATAAAAARLAFFGLVHAERAARSEEHTSELQSRLHLVCRLLLEKKKKTGDGCHSPR